MMQFATFDGSQNTAAAICSQPQGIRQGNPPESRQPTQSDPGSAKRNFALYAGSNARTEESWSPVNRSRTRGIANATAQIAKPTTYHLSELAAEIQKQQRSARWCQQKEPEQHTHTSRGQRHDTHFWVDPAGGEAGRRSWAGCPAHAPLRRPAEWRARRSGSWSRASGSRRSGTTWGCAALPRGGKGAQGRRICSASAAVSRLKEGNHLSGPASAVQGA